METVIHNVGDTSQPTDPRWNGSSGNRTAMWTICAFLVRSQDSGTNLVAARRWYCGGVAFADGLCQIGTIRLYGMIANRNCSYRVDIEDH